MLTGEHTVKFITLAANLGLHFRPRHAINDPNGGSGLGIGNEWRWALGGFIPLKDGKYRIGGTFFGSTGIESDNIIGDTFFKKQNTPIEWQVEGRMKFGPSDHWWVGAGGGSRLFVNAYGAPDLRLIGLIGIAVQNALVLVTQVRALHAEGVPFAAALREAAIGRVRPKLMTAGTAIFGLLPLLVLQLPGTEIERPLAVVMVGGLLTSTVFTLVALPAVFSWVEGLRGRWATRRITQAQPR